MNIKINSSSVSCLGEFNIGETGFFLKSLGNNGYHLVRSGRIDENLAIAKSELYQFALKIGKICEQNSSGTLVKEVYDRGISYESANARYSETRNPGEFHTDGAERPQLMPKIVCLQCVNRATYGGHTVVIAVRRIYDSLFKLNPDYIYELSRPLAWDTRESAPVFFAPIFHFKENTLHCRYLRRYIESGFRRAGMKIEQSIFEALDAFDSILYDQKNWTRILLEPGDILIIDNTRCLHGREAYRDECGNQRFLLRLWIT